MGVTYTSAGEEFVSDVMLSAVGGSTTASGWYIGWGTGTATDQKSDTALDSEATEARVTATSETQPTADKNQWVGTLTAETAKTINEAGLLTAATGGTLVIRGTHSAVSVATGDKIEYTVSLQQA